MMIGPRTDYNHLPINSYLIVKCITKYLLKTSQQQMRTINYCFCSEWEDKEDQCTEQEINWNL